MNELVAASTATTRFDVQDILVLMDDQNVVGGVSTDLETGVFINQQATKAVIGNTLPTMIKKTCRFIIQLEDFRETC